MQFTVERATWRCGMNGSHKHGEGDTILENGAGYRCCLGFVGSQLGIPDAVLRDNGCPDTCNEADSKLVPVLCETWTYGVADNALARDAMSINDCDKLTRDEREKKLIELFAKHGHELTFSGAYAA